MIHDDHPFQTPPDDRDPVRQFRGRLVAPVTVLTAGNDGRRAALTVSSLMVAEGDPALVIALVGSTTDLWEAVSSTERFVVHILAAAQRGEADVFAGIRPRPGGMFNGMAIEDSEWGPVLADAPNRLYCRLRGSTELSFHHVIEATIEQVDLADLTDPAVYFRGRYQTLR